MISRLFRVASCLALAAICVFESHALAAEPGLVILPREVTLTGSAGSQRFLVLDSVDGVITGEVRFPTEEENDQRALLGSYAWQELVITSDNENVVKVGGDMLIPFSNGTATVTAKVVRHESRKEDVVERSAQMKVTVVDSHLPQHWNFRNHVQAVFAKTGCNSGACHGALAGKGGLKLSLRGYDIERDYQTLTRQARGRRVELADPGRSLILAKPSGAIPHKGGLRFDVDSHDYRVIAGWIADGAPAPTENDPRVTRLEILPEFAKLSPNSTQQMIVRAHYNDGHVEDVTHWSKYTATNESVAKVDDTGKVTVVGPGEGAVTAWFASQVVVARVALPYPNTVAPEVFAQAERRNFIDELVLAKLKSLNLPPSPAATDGEFIRRAFLDTIGTLPTAEETKAYLADTSPDKRDKLIDALLARPEFSDYWTYKWSDMLLINGQKLRPKAVEAYYKWVKEEVKTNTPWDQLVRKIVTSTGSSYEQGATNFFALHQDPEQMAENVSQAFLGLSIGCAKCHNHPLEKWTNNQYYGMANLFARVRAKGWGGDFRSGDGLRTLYVVPEGELIQPLTGKPQPPTPLDGEALPFDATGDRREHLANWLVSPENPYFSRSIANRVWANFFGVGLVEQVDDMRISNPASNEELLAATAKYVEDEHFNLKALMREILRSATYQRSSVPLAENKDEKRFYSHYYPKRLMAEVLLDAISQVTLVPTEFTQIGFPGGDSQKTEAYPKGTKALQLADSAVVSYFLKTFGRNDRLITCECERSEEPSIVQVLHIANGTTINEKLSAEGSCVKTALAANETPEQIVDRAYLSCLSRVPTEQEKTELLKVLQESGETNQALLIEDLYWSILSSKEFLFNH